MSDFYHGGSRALRDQFDTRRLAIASQRVERSAFVPRTGCETPVPNWKKNEWAGDVLPEKDPARTR